jgi:tRNA A-37 threonylcarbamoyl transferase component Bud32
VSRQNDAFLKQKMGDYVLKEIIAIGGMARVYLGIDNKLQRKAAVKVLELSQDWVDETIVQRFEREAKSVASLEHENIITIYQYGEHGTDAYYLAMQYIDGQDLRRLLRDYRNRNELMPPEEGIYIMRQVAAAMDYAHSSGVIHRDIKPSNVLLNKDNKATLTDFGLVLWNEDHTLGTAFGTPRYIAPEQAVASQQAVPQSDIYALAVIMYEILTGITPFDGDTPMEIAISHINDDPLIPSKHNASVPEAVDAAVLKALSKEPSDRYETAADFVEAVANGYGMGAGLAIVSTPDSLPVASESVTRAPEPFAEEIRIHGASPGDKLPAPPRRGRVLMIALVVVLLVAGGGYAVFGSEITALFDGAIDPVTTQNTITLTYDAESFLIHNTTGGRITQTDRLYFVRGLLDSGGDDYSGSRIPRDTLAADQCFRIQRLDGNSVPIDSDGCVGDVNFEALSNAALFHWRFEPNNISTFKIYWDGEEIHSCDTVREGEQANCTFEYPLPAITEAADDADS